MSQRGQIKMAIAVILPLVAAILGFGLRGLVGLKPPATPQDQNCLDLIDRPVSVLLDHTFVKATAIHYGPGWVVIPIETKGAKSP